MQGQGEEVTRPASLPKLRLRSAHVQHIGYVRTNQEDAFLDEPLLYAVADGMGGHEAGEIASRLAIEAVRDGLTNSSFDVDRTFRAAHVRVLSVSQRHYRGHGTTLTVLSFRGGSGLIGHVGDSRVYRVRDGRGEQITKDHVSWGHAISNCIGVSKDSFKGADVSEIDVEVGDVYVLATDGLTNYLDARDVIPFVVGPRHDGFAQNVADALVRAALAAGGQDNVTVVVVEVLS